MPNARVLEEKKKAVAGMTERLKSKSGVFVDYRGITGIEATQMRAALREANVQYSVIKNSLMRFAIKNVGFDELDGILAGTMSLATSADDPIAPARIIKEYSDKLPDYFEVKAGFMDGRILSKDEVLAIANIPPLPMLQAQFLGTLLAPISKLAVVLKAAAEKGVAESGVEDTEEASKEVKAEEAPAEAKADDPAAEAAAEAVPEAKTEEAPAAEATPEAKSNEPAAQAAPEEASETKAEEEPASEETPE